MSNFNFEKATVFNVVDNLKYQSQSIVIKSILRKNTGEITAISFDRGEILIGKISPFDAFVQIIDGSAEIIIDDNSNPITAGQAIIIPAHSPNIIKAKTSFKMILTIIKHGYEEIIL